MNKSQKFLTKVKNMNEDSKEHIPNEETLRAIEEAEKGNLKRCTVKEFMEFFDKLCSEKNLPDE